jgi:tetratricopeptide (TPR) repeat protein
VSESNAYDLFISHAPGQREPARRLADALHGLGLSCAETPARDDDPAVPAELARAKALLAWASSDYFHSRACQAHLAAACLAQGRESSPARRRVLLLNPEPGLKHIYPVRLRDGLFAAAPNFTEAPDLAALAERLRAQCEGLAGSLESLRPLAEPPWRTAYGGRPAPAPHFERRERELWDIHALLRPEEPAPRGAEPGPAVAVTGLAGEGKTWLAREYALRFGPAYPGGVFWLTAREAKPTASVADLAENPALKMQLLAFLDALSALDCPRDAEVPTLIERLGTALELAGQPFLWIVDGLPDGLNGPAFRQWRAPAGVLGRTLFTTRSLRHDEEAESIHPLPLEAETAWRILTRESPPNSGAERAHTAKLLGQLGRNALAATAGNAAARADRRHRNAPYAELRKRLRDPYREASSIACHLCSGLPPAQESSLAAALLAAIRTLDLPGRDLLRLAALLGDAPLPERLLADCLLGSGLCAETRRRWLPDGLMALLGKRRPSQAETARWRTHQGMASLRRLGLGELAAGCLSLHPLIAQAMRIADSDLARLSALRRGALLVLHGVAADCAAAADWKPLLSLAPHGRALAAEARGQASRCPEPPQELALRSRLAAFLGDMDLDHGAPQRALMMYRQAAAGLARAAAADAEAWELLLDLARVRERSGDILAARGDLPGALDTYLKSLRIRKRLTGQDPEREDWQLNLWAMYLKAGGVLAETGDLEKARNSYRAALTVRSGLAASVPADGELELELAAGFEQLAARYSRAGDSEAALDALAPAAGIYQKLAGQRPDCPDLTPARAHAEMGELLRQRGDNAGALERQRQAIAEYERLAALEPGNPEWRRGLELGHDRAADLLEALQDPAGAARHRRARLAALERLIAAGAVDVQRQREVAAGYARLGKTHEQAQDAESALDCYRKARQLAREWTDLAPEDSALLDELAWAWERLAALEAEAAEAAESPGGEDRQSGGDGITASEPELQASGA